LTEKLTLISKSECSADEVNTVTEEEAEKFLEVDTGEEKKMETDAAGDADNLVCDSGVDPCPESLFLSIVLVLEGSVLVLVKSGPYLEGLILVLVSLVLVFVLEGLIFVLVFISLVFVLVLEGSIRVLVSLVLVLDFEGLILVLVLVSLVLVLEGLIYVLVLVSLVLVLLLVLEGLIFVWVLAGPVLAKSLMLLETLFFLKYSICVWVLYWELYCTVFGIQNLCYA